MSESSKSRRSGLQAMSHRQVFGSENAADDDLLEECYVAPPGVVLDRAILIGKWGTGKTGLLLYRNAGLSQSLRNVDPDKDRIWYLDETGIQLQTLKHIEKTCSGDMHLAKRVLEELWTSEIIRTAASILVELYDFYGAPSGSHWKTLNSLLSRSTKKSVWDILRSALVILIATARAGKAADRGSPCNS